MALFENLLTNLNWNSVTELQNTEQALDTFNDIWSTSFETCFPLKRVFTNRRTHKINDFFTSGLLISRSHKMTLYHKFLKSRSLDDKRLYTSYRNCYNKVVKLSKKLHFNLKIDKNCNPKNAWEYLNEAIGKVGKSSSSISDILYKDKLITDPISIADSFNDFFSNIVKDIPNTLANFDYEIPNYHHDSFQFTMVDDAKVNEVIKSLEPKFTLDINGYNTILIKRVSEKILTPLVHIINLSLKEGVFPDSLKISRVCPIFKQGDHKDMNNYRPISCLSAFSKIFEKVVHDQLFTFLNTNNILTKHQFGFQKGKSTVHALTQIMNYISNAFINNKFVIACFLDYRKAFDLVSHDILLKKLDRIGVNGLCLEWFRSYLMNRKMYTSVNNHLSSIMRVINRSVPQGSILGPLLFLIFINDMPNSTDLLSILFADDTTGLTCGDDINTIGPFINSELQKIGMWLKANELSINTSKTKIMIFSKNRIIQDFKFVFNNNDMNGPQDPNLISSVERICNSSSIPTFKMLGIHFDEHLSFENHCKKVLKKLNSALYMITRAKHILSPKSLHRLYYAMIHPHLLYCLSIYSCTGAKNITLLYKKQKQCIRIINKAKYNAHTEPLFFSSNILPFPDLITLNKLLFMHPIAHNQSVVKFPNFRKLSEIQEHPYPLRNLDDFYIQRTDCQKVTKMPLINLPYTWNSIDETFKCITSRNIFKNKIKLELMEKHADFHCNKTVCISCMNL